MLSDSTTDRLRKVINRNLNTYGSRKSDKGIVSKKPRTKELTLWRMAWRKGP